MAGGQISSVLRYVRRVVGAPAAEGRTDRHLLECFSRRRDQDAFALLVDRHGPMVLGVCRRVLGDAHAAEDAFQATFLVLAHNAGSACWHDSVAGWLHQVARRIAARARGQAGRRRFHERRAGALAPAEPLPEQERRELRALLDEELSRLPGKYRHPLVLCYLEGKTNEEAARQLGWTKGTVSGRLARARDLLRGRLIRRGLALSAAALAAELGPDAAAAVPAALARATVGAAVLAATGQVGGIAAPVAALVKGALRTMWLTKLKTALALVLLLAVGGATAVLALGPAAVAPADNPARKEAGKAAEPVKGLKLTLKAGHPEIVLSPFQDRNEPAAYSLLDLGLVCTFTNETDRPLKLDAYNPEGKIKLDLKGPDGKSVSIFQERLALAPVPPATADDYPILAPGKPWTTRFPVGGGWMVNLFNRPGRYTLEASYASLPASENELAAGSWTGRLLSNHVAVQVRGSGGPLVNNFRLAVVLDAPETFLMADGAGAEPVKLRVVFTNCGKEPYKLDIYDLVWRDLRLEVKGPDGRGVRVDSPPYNRIVGPPRAEDFPVVGPGKTWVSGEVAAFPGPFGEKVYHLLQPGDYRVRVVYLHTPDQTLRHYPEARKWEKGCWSGELRSNEVVLRVLPRGAEAVGGLKLTLSAGETQTALDPAGKAEPVPLRFTFTNTTDKAIRLNRFDLLRSGLRLEVTGPDGGSVRRARAGREDAGPPTSLDFWAVMPGRSWSPADVAFPGGPAVGGTGYGLVKPGEYRIRAFYSPPVPTARDQAAVKRFGGDSWAGRLTSNVLVLKVVPASEGVRSGDRALAVARPEAERALDAAYADYRKWAAGQGAATPKREGPWIVPADKHEVIERPWGWQVRWWHTAKSGYSYSVTLEVRRNGKVQVLEAGASFASA
jgi:RNA polymerase sigma factor (sigma-70 family)